MLREKGTIYFLKKKNQFYYL